MEKYTRDFMYRQRNTFIMIYSVYIYIREFTVIFNFDINFFLMCSLAVKSINNISIKET